jgi:hypothetical protein
MKRILFILITVISISTYAQNVGVGNAAPASKLDLSGDLALREGTAFTVAAGSNTLTLPAAKNSVYRLTGAAGAFTISGISAGNDGMVLTLINATSQVMTMSNSSTVQTNTGADLVAASTVSSVNLIYNATLSKWMVLSSEGFPATAMATNIYTADGTLTGPRTVTMGTNNLTFSSSTGNLVFTPSSTASVVVGSGDATGTPVGGILRGPNAGAGTTAGGNLTINAGYAYGSAAGGSIFINGGTTSGSGTNGNIYLRGGYTSPNEGAVYLNDDHGGSTFMNAAGGIVTIGNASAGTAQLNVYNGLSIDNAGTNNGTLGYSNGTTTANGLTFGLTSGEGIASNRVNTAAGTNQYGVDIYTDFIRRLSVTNTGGVGINTATLGTGSMLSITNPAATQTLSVYPGYLQGTANASYTTLDMPGTANLYIWDNLEVASNVGIGTASPSQTLSINGSAGVWNNNAINFYTDGGSTMKGQVGFSSTGGSDMTLRSTTSGSWLRLGANAGSISFFPDNNVTTNNAPMVKINQQSSNSGSVATAIYAVLEVWGVAGSPISTSTTSANQTHTQYGWLATSGNGTSSVNGRAYSLYTWGSIWCNGEVDATSDERIKDVLDTSDNLRDLTAVNKLQVVDYKYKDKASHGDTKVKGFLAQNVETVFPDAVKKQPGMIPDIYKYAETVSYDSTTKELTMTLAAAHGLVAGDKVQLIDPRDGKSEGKIVYVSAVRDAKTFTVGSWTDNSKAIFVYGKEVPDLRNIDYNKIFSAGISAIQELSKQLSTEQQHNAALQQQLSQLKKENTDTRSDVDKLKASVETLQQILGSKAQK